MIVDPKILDLLFRPGVQSSEVVVASVTAILQVATALGTSDAALQRHALSCVTLIVLGVLFSRALTKFAAALACRKHADEPDVPPAPTPPSGE